MKKLVLIIVAVFIKINNANAQASIVNSGFETWINPLPVAQEPEGFHSDNYPFIGPPMPPIPSVLPCTKSSNAHSGNSSVLLQSIVNGSDTASGFLAIGSYNSAPQPMPARGVAYTSRPHKFVGYYFLENIPANDTALILVFFTKQNLNSPGGADVLGRGIKHIFTSNSGFQAFEIPIEWLSTVSPDTLRIEIVASLKRKNGAKLYIDDLAFNGVAGVEFIYNNPGVYVFTNPLDKSLTFSSNISEIETIELLDICGKNIETIKFLNREMKIDLSFINSGLYLCISKDKYGNVVSSDKIIF
jgi:hypothetical protein